MTFTDPNLIHEPAAGKVVPAFWGGVVRDDLEHLADPPAASVFAQAAQLVSSEDLGADEGAALSAPGKHFDSAAMHDPGEENSRIHVTEAGRYLAVAGVFVDGGADLASDYRLVVDFLVNGTTVVRGDARSYAAATPTHGVKATRTLELSAGDFVEVTVLQDSGDEREVTLQEFSLVWIGVSL